MRKDLDRFGGGIQRRSESSQTSRMKFFVKIVNYFVSSFILEV